MALLANLKQNTSNVANWAGQHKSGICLWLSLASLVTTVICVADEAPKAKEALKKRKKEREEEGLELTEEPIKYFYAPARCTSDWHESQVFVLEHGNHKFFKER